MIETLNGVNGKENFLYSKDEQSCLHANFFLLYISQAFDKLANLRTFNCKSLTLVFN